LATLKTLSKPKLELLGGQSFLSGESQCMGGCADRFHPPGGLVTVPSYTLHLWDIYANFVAILREHAFLLTRL